MVLNYFKKYNGPNRNIHTPRVRSHSGRGCLGDTFRVKRLAAALRATVLAEPAVAGEASGSMVAA